MAPIYDKLNLTQKSSAANGAFIGSGGATPNHYRIYLSTPLLPGQGSIFVYQARGLTDDR